MRGLIHGVAWTAHALPGGRAGGEHTRRLDQPRVRAMSAPSASRLSGGLSRRFDDSGSVLLRCTAGR
ncbi:hypothetical protein [Nonomuraea sp. NPDC049141]|uniref:hypothetical protein n=1 Tax=Nonomuraea sp. NPDC049141 TaxID=3155500 RepID=UPI00340E2B1A